ncbi:MAG: hypothetical protein D6719_05020 [Candidatus Dadabacteria bacterium]|nr:MAG: hypothetical protein D6719_05020 [Candidatus Dadabacteria bacterium]
MVQTLGKIIISLMITNWLYQEATILVPKFDRFARNIYQTVRIPTHNEWPAIMRKGPAALLEHRVTSRYPGLVNREVRKLWNSGNMRSVENLVYSTLQDNLDDIPYLRDAMMFISRAESRKYYYIPEVSTPYYPKLS